jgi:hypothetical protein
MGVVLGGVAAGAGGTMIVGADSHKRSQSAQKCGDLQELLRALCSFVATAWFGQPREKDVVHTLASPALGIVHESYPQYNSAILFGS